MRDQFPGSLNKTHSMPKRVRRPEGEQYYHTTTNVFEKYILIHFVTVAPHLVCAIVITLLRNRGNKLHKQYSMAYTAVSPKSLSHKLRFTVESVQSAHSNSDHQISCNSIHACITIQNQLVVCQNLHIIFEAAQNNVNKFKIF